MSSATERVAARLPDNDAVLILGVLFGLYVGFTVLGMALGLDIAGLASTLQRITFFAAVYALLALALNLQWGYAGLLNIGVAGFMAVGVYTMAMLTAPASPAAGGVPGLGLPLWVGVVGGMVAAALVGALAALPALRLKADYLAIVTLGLSEIIRLTYNSTTFQTFSIAGADLGTGASQGIQTPTNPVMALYYTTPSSPAAGKTGLGEAVFGFFKTLGLDEPVVVDWTYTIVLVIFVGLFYLLLTRVGNSPFGRVLKAIREDELVASSLGKNTNRFKIKTFMLGCALMGLGGILWQGSQQLVNPALFLPIITFYVFIALIIGGSGSNTGSVIGGALFAGLLFEGPTFVRRLVQQTVDLGGAPNTFTDAIAALGSLDVGPLLAYTLADVSSLRFVLVGVVLVYLVQNRPDGLLGHRKETAAAVSLARERTAAGQADGGETEVDDE
ncbi:high-affinity branched-chain amino acid transport protein [Halococcus morrhuae DSM 1307]|uniref:High-affinity branched-chain amino acid transport protein n=1 Tax=Halococcus morrhuae DSM 1307 TaxID=931277 RepID=M0MW91_HALMO|nr:branched-chain amino acid ABC transporter permease [Halococcus morrhuae]EMA49089.1 high-affinity branched-chain amino acid transport protein [Halococcus morrhuae DSM 1307]